MDRPAFRLSEHLLPLAILFAALGLLIACPLHAQDAQPQPSPTAVTPAVVSPVGASESPTSNSEAPALCLNCSSPSAAVYAGASMTMVPDADPIAKPYGEVLGEVGLTIGKRTPARAWVDVVVGTRTADGAPGDPGSATLGDVSSWSSVEALAGISTVVGRAQYEDGHEVLTSLFVAAGGKAPISSSADATPRVARQFLAGLRIQETKSQADVTLGLGRDEEGLPSEPVANPDGSIQRSLQAIVHARLPIPGTRGIAWLVGRASVNLLRVDGSRDIVTVGLAISPGDILSKIKGS
jgi:hypothetical protein